TPFAIFLGTFLAIAGAIGLNQRDAIVAMGQRLLEERGASLFLPFALLSLFVVALHELGHAFTLKQYGRQVPKSDCFSCACFPPPIPTPAIDIACLDGSAFSSSRRVFWYKLASPRSHLQSRSSPKNKPSPFKPPRANDKSSPNGFTTAKVASKPKSKGKIASITTTTATAIKSPASRTDRPPNEVQCKL
ncbi:MAG: hypothetical protein SVX43_12965, partial [Cyanobacteriota bacterium]|nr:hypothetical protein [Cyanobacteriota bacterium]